MNGQITPFARSLNEVATKNALSAIQQYGRALPARVVSVDGAIVRVAFDVISTFTLPQVDMPLFGPEYIRYPIKAGDLGMVIPADARLGAVSGMSSSVPDLTLPSNLGGLFFMPLGNKNWTAVDPERVTIYGPDGVLIRDTDSNSAVDVTPTKVTLYGPDGVLLRDEGDNTSLDVTETAITGEASQTVAFDAGTTLTISVGSVSIVITSAGIAMNGPVTLNGALLTGSGTGAGDATLTGTVSVGTLMIGGFDYLAHGHSGVVSGVNTSGPVVT